MRGVLALELEHHPPVARHPNRPLAFSIAMQSVKSIARQIHPLRFAAIVQNFEHTPQFFNKLSIEALGIARFEQPFQPLVAKAFYHMVVYAVALRLTIENGERLFRFGDGL
jgi:hypothetical protein